jgi:hypothetical protein
VTGGLATLQLEQEPIPFLDGGAGLAFGFRRPVGVFPGALLPGRHRGVSLAPVGDREVVGQTAVVKVWTLDGLAQGPDGVAEALAVR